MKRILIVGGGFSGTMLAYYLVAAGHDVTVVERTNRVAAGVAYGSCSPEMLLNVPVEKMGALPESEDGFFSWCAAQGLSFQAGAYVPRVHYANYLGQFLPKNIRLCGAEVVSLALTNDGVTASLSVGGDVTADYAVLACGNLARKNFFGAELESPRIVGDPWEDNRWISLDADRVLVVGASLTAVDVALHALSRPQTSVVMISRHGQLPLARGTGLGRETLPESVFTLKRTRDVFALLRRLSERTDWKDLFEGIRGQITPLWQSLPIAEQRRFLRHAATYWNIHRHRLPNETRAILDRAVSEGRLRVIAGRIKNFADCGDEVEVALCKRHTRALSSIRGELLVNCLGPADAPQQARSTLFSQLLRDGLIEPHPNGVGLNVERNGFRILANGSPQPRLFAIGHWLRGDRWESTAVPQLRVQAKDLARYFA